MSKNPYTTVELKRWPCFKDVDYLLIDDIILLHIFGMCGQSACFVTSFDDVYAVGTNMFGNLGIGEISATDTPVKIDILCKKNVAGFSSGTVHTVAYTKGGDMYSWGDNNFGKLGNGTILAKDTPGRVILPANTKVVLAVCSDRYTMALTSEHKVLHWGDIDWCNGSTQTLPTLLEFPEGVDLSSIACGSLHAAALSTDGRVYTWGCGVTGQLGHGQPEERESQPILVRGQLEGKLVRQIACTLAATIALTTEGLVFAWGLNKNSVLGLGLDIEIVPCPQQVQLNHPVLSIAAAGFGNIITAVTEEHIYSWGERGGGTRPHTVYAGHVLNVYKGCPTPRWERVGEVELQSCIQDQTEISENEGAMLLKRDIGTVLFNNKEYSDFRIRLTDGVVFVHKLILRTFCEHFKSMLDGEWAENKKDEVDMTSYDPYAYRAFLKYIYTASLDDSLSGSQLIDLCDIAESYFEKELKMLTITKFSTCLTVENVAEFFSTADSLHCQEIKDLCCEFTSSRLVEVILSEGFDKLKGDLCKTLMKNSAKLRKDNLNSGAPA